MKKLHVEYIDEKPKSKKEKVMDKECTLSNNRKDGKCDYMACPIYFDSDDYDEENKDCKHRNKKKANGMTEMIKFITEHGVGEDGKKVGVEEATAIVEHLDGEEKEELMAENSLESYEVKCIGCGAKNIRSRTYCWYCDADLEAQRKKEVLDEVYEEDNDYYAEKSSQMIEDEEAWIRWEKQQRGEVVDKPDTIEADEKWRKYWRRRENIKDDDELKGFEEYWRDFWRNYSFSITDERKVEVFKRLIDFGYNYISLAHSDKVKSGKYQGKTLAEIFPELIPNNIEAGHLRELAGVTLEVFHDCLRDDIVIDTWYKKRILDTDGKWKLHEELREDNS